MPERFDLDELAPNGLKRGFTTGTCATAAVKAALLHRYLNLAPESVEVRLPGDEKFLEIPVFEVGDSSATVMKDAGDDPDQTHRALIRAWIRERNEPGVRFVAGPGVGTVTQPGLQIPVGEPAINPVPRAMIEAAIREVTADLENPPPGFEVEIGCERGAEIAKRTFNPRLGIEGGISILGTSGIVEPKSLASFKASIAIYINVAIADEPRQVVFSPGNLGQRFARNELNVAVKRVVQMSNFVGFALDRLTAKLEGNGQVLPELWIVGHPGKLAKLIGGYWDTHSSKSPPATGILGSEANTVEAMVQELGASHETWKNAARLIRKAVEERVRNVEEVHVRLFSMAGVSLG